MGYKIADELRGHAGHLKDPRDRKLFLEIADEIDRDHETRMRQCACEVRRRLCKDIRWAVNMFESGHNGRQSVREKAGEVSEDEPMGV